MKSQIVQRVKSLVNSFLEESKLSIWIQLFRSCACPPVEPESVNTSVEAYTDYEVVQVKAEQNPEQIDVDVKPVEIKTVSAKRTGLVCDKCNKYVKRNKTGYECRKFDRPNMNKANDYMHNGILCKSCFHAEHDEPDEPCGGHMLVMRNGSGGSAVW